MKLKGWYKGGGGGGECRATTKYRDSEVFGVVSNVGCPLQWLMFCFMGITIVTKYFFVYGVISNSSCPLQWLMFYLWGHILS